MATQTRPFLMTGAALATAAAVVAASPGLAPSASIASPNALSSAAYQLTTFADVFTIPSEEWTNVLFGSSSYGGYVGPDNTPLAVEPWATYCSYTCTISGISGALYLGLDALVNGNGGGWEDRDNWNVGIVNYFFEPTFARTIGGGGGNFTVQTGTAGLSAATAYILQATLGQASPVLSTFIELAFYGPYLLTIAYEDFLNFAASAVSGVPVIGPFIADSITAYAGELPAPGYIPVENEIYYTAGLSGVLQYWINTLSGGLIPPPQTAAAVAAPLVARAAAAVTESVTAPAVEAAAPAVEAAPVEASVSATDASASVDTPAADAPESAPVEVTAPTAADVKADAAPVDSASSAVADATSDTTSDPTAQEAPAPAPSKATSKRPVRDAIAKVTTSITSAVDSVKAGASAPAADAS